jgi:hypothetical protein
LYLLAYSIYYDKRIFSIREFGKYCSKKKKRKLIVHLYKNFRVEILLECIKTNSIRYSIDEC